MYLFFASIELQARQDLVGLECVLYVYKMFLLYAKSSIDM